MTWDQWGVTASGVFLIVVVVWFFWLKSGPRVRASEVSDVQEALVVVKGGYTPDTIVVQAGRPVRIHFRRDETAACSEMVLFPDFETSATLPTGETVAVDLLPEKTGEFEFACQMGMLRGRLVVE